MCGPMTDEDQLALNENTENYWQQEKKQVEKTSASAITRIGAQNSIVELIILE